MLLFAALLALSSSCDRIRERGLFGRKARTLEILKAQQDSIRIADSLKRVENRQRAIEEARLDSVLKAEAEKASFEARNRYNIVVGSFITPEYARMLADEYRNMGYDARIIRTDTGRFEYVVAESHDLYSEAKLRLEQYQDTVDVFSWLYIIR